MTRDFTLSRYEALCKELISSSYRSITVQEYIQGKAAEPFVILRHDVDRRPEMAGMEKDGDKGDVLFQDDAWGVRALDNCSQSNIIYLIM